MPRLSRSDLAKREEIQRNVITIKPSTDAKIGGFPWLALAPLAAAAATPVLGSLGKWVGKKVFGESKQAGAGVLRSGDRVSVQPATMPIGRGRSIRAGDLPQPKLVAVPAKVTGTQPGTVGGFNPLQAILNPLSMLGLGRKKGGAKKGGKSKCKGKGTSEMKAKMAALRAMKKGGKKKVKS